MIPLIHGLSVLALGIGAIGLGYHLLLALFARRPLPELRTGEHPRIAVLIPAHNEAAHLGDLLADLRGQTTPPEVVLVVADRCTDETEAIAARRGATVLSLKGEHGGKGAALSAGISFLEHSAWDSVLVVDADCRLDAGFLSVTDAGRDEVVQGRVSLRAAADGGGLVYDFFSRIENEVFHRGRARLGLPGFLRGTGMLLGREALARCPWRSGDLTEDREQGYHFLRAGIPVRHDPRLSVETLPPRAVEESWAQRRRWTSVGLPAHLAAALGTAWAARDTLGRRGAELPVAVLADARSQWGVLLLLGAAGAFRIGDGVRDAGLGLVATAACFGTMAGIRWYGIRFLGVAIQVPVSVGLAAVMGLLSLVGVRPGSWRRGRQT
jgi:hypothetical protein